MTHKRLIASLVSVALLGVVTPVRAMENERSTAQAALEERIQQARAKRQSELEQRAAEATHRRAERAANAIARCDAVESRLSQRQTAHEENSGLVVRRFLLVHERLSALEGRLNEAGLDTSQFVTDLATFADLITAVETAYTTYSTSLETTAGYTCGSAEREFRAELTSTRRAFSAYRAAVREARIFLEQTIRADLRELKAQAEAN